MGSGGGVKNKPINNMVMLYRQGKSVCVVGNPAGNNVPRKGVPSECNNNAQPSCPKVMRPQVSPAGSRTENSSRDIGRNPVRR